MVTSPMTKAMSAARLEVQTKNQSGSDGDGGDGGDGGGGGGGGGDEGDSGGASKTCGPGDNSTYSSIALPPPLQHHHHHNQHHHHHHPDGMMAPLSVSGLAVGLHVLVNGSAQPRLRARVEMIW